MMILMVTVVLIMVVLLLLTVVMFLVVIMKFFFLFFCRNDGPTAAVYRIHQQQVPRPAPETAAAGERHNGVILQHDQVKHVLC